MGYFGDIESKLGVFVFLAADGHLTAMGLHHLIHVVQSETKARDAALAVLLVYGGSPELVEDHLLLFLRHTDTVVTYL